MDGGKNAGCGTPQKHPVLGHDAVVEVVNSPMHINVDSIFERERQPDGVVMEILLILEVIAAKRMRPVTVGLTDRWMQLQSTEIAKTKAKFVPGALLKSDFLFRDIFWLKLQTYADGNIPAVDIKDVRMEHMMMGGNTVSLPAGVEVEEDVTRHAVLVHV